MHGPDPIVDPVFGPGPSIALLLLAPFIGSFLGVLARRIPRGESVISPCSHCETCGRTLPLPAMIPIVSHLALRGRAACCGAPIAVGHLAIELLAVLIPAILLAVAPDAAPSDIVAGSILGWWLLALAAIDLACWRLPDALTLPLLLAGLAEVWLAQDAPLADLSAPTPDWSWAWTWAGLPPVLVDHAEAALLGFAALALLASLYRRVRGRDGIGMGDAKLLAAGGAWCGLAALPWIVLIGAGTGIVFGFVRHGRDARGATAIPFGPTLAFGIWAAFLLQIA